jgi:hypothetical protein
VLRAGRCRRAGDGLAARAAEDAARKPRAAVACANEPLLRARHGRAGHESRRLPRARRGRAGTPGALHAAQGPRTRHEREQRARHAGAAPRTRAAPRRRPRRAADASSERAPRRGRPAGARRPRALGPSWAGAVHHAEATAEPRSRERGGNRAGDRLAAPAPRQKRRVGLRRALGGLRASRSPAARHGRWTKLQATRAEPRGQPGREGGEGGERGGTHRGTRPSGWTRWR